MKTVRMSEFPKNLKGIIVNYDNEDDSMPLKIIDMGLVPGTEFIILYQAPFSGPLYIEFGSEKSRIALRPEEGEFIWVRFLG